MKNYLCAYILKFCGIALDKYVVYLVHVCVCIFNNIVDHYENGLFPWTSVLLFVYIMKTVIISAHLWLNWDLYAEQASININFWFICTNKCIFSCIITWCFIKSYRYSCTFVSLYFLCVQTQASIHTILFYFICTTLQKKTQSQQSLSECCSSCLTEHLCF